ncbi:MAG: decarboxylating NADP(+)-dependent phosphogluconate dehydrogenase, partial [Oscillospiraceae bacterium]|nr:decarboxylating NADP(+)-dependent phosphogluconate dehydrogenase [Oscillospiraceae bacterium]
MRKADVGMIGLAVMGENLVMNMESRGFAAAVYNLEEERTRDFVSGRAKGKNIQPAYSIRELCEKLSRPRVVMMMIRAGDPVDQCVERLIGCLEPGDVIIDGGNSHYMDTARRAAYVESKGMLYVGSGVSGGEEGALKGPSMMPGGSPDAWPLVKGILQSISARVDGVPCCQWVGPGGAGHFVKMVHNGVEYGDMQLICEAYQIMRDGLRMSAPQISDVFRGWNQGELNSYLIEITGDILAYKDEDGSPLADRILDVAGQKGTGKWAVNAALDSGVPLTLIGEAVFARYLSALKEERVAASAVLKGPANAPELESASVREDLRRALYASKIVSYAQGFQLMRQAARDHQWTLDYGDIALMWRGGCIIRSAFLGKIKQAFDRDPHLPNLMLDPYFAQALHDAQDSWRRVCSAAILSGTPVPAFTAALSYYDGYRARSLPANLLQAQRDYFGAHTY